MIKSSIKFILRHLWNNRLYSSIKIAGLTIGMACAFLAILFVRDENSYDRFHEKGDRLFRITTSVNNPLEGGNQIMGATGQVQGPAFKENIPEIEDYTRIWAGLSTNFIAGHKALFVNYIYADESFFNMFSFPLLQGNPVSALKSLNSVVLTEQTAIKFFGRTDVLGKTIELEEGHGRVTFVVSGVAKNIPTHSSIQFEAVLPFTYLQTMFPDEYWLNSYLSTFVLLHPKAVLSAVKTKFAQVFNTKAHDQLIAAKMLPDQVNYGLQPITAIHINHFEKGATPIIGRGNLNESSIETYSYLLLGIAVFILIMAAVNFINLSIVGSLKRSKEIGVRKISGGTSKQIVWQFLTEALILCAISYLLAIFLVTGILPVFNKLAQKNIRFSFPSDIVFFLYGLMLMVVCMLLVGLYPAIKLSMFNTVEVLYNRQKLGGKHIFTKGLTVLQFTLAVGLLNATIIYYRQMNFITQNDLGYNARDIVRIHLPNYRNVNLQTISELRNELLSNASIIQVTNGTMIPSSGLTVILPGGNIETGESKIDPFFFSTMGIALQSGRSFSDEFASDSIQSVIVNETFIRQTGIRDPLGSQITVSDGLGVKYHKTIQGVVKDFHYASLKEKIAPLILKLGVSEDIWVKLQKGKSREGLASIESIFKKTFPDYFYQYSFTEDEIRDQYESEFRWKQIISYAAMLAIIICCIGLFGLAHFAVLKRRKEMGIRKVLGASGIVISRLLSQDFLKLVFLAIIVATPIAWNIMNNWLQTFTYRIHISLLDFLFAACLALLIALITVSSQAFRAAIANPVDSLRME